MDQLHLSGEKLFLPTHPRFIKSWEEPAGRGEVSSSLLKRDDAARQTEEWYLHLFQAKAVKVCDVPQEKLIHKVHQ